jgi:hypothetical protein
MAFAADGSFLPAFYCELLEKHERYSTETMRRYFNETFYFDGADDPGGPVPVMFGFF